MTDFIILSRIYDILKQENVISDSLDGKYVEFKQPKELQKILNLKIEEKGIGNEEMENVFKNVAKYSVKVNHKGYQNELSGAMDPYCLAAGWVTEALNNIQFTYEAGPVVTLIDNFMIAKMLEIFELPSTGDGVFCAGGSQANMYGMILARQLHCPEIKENGAYGLPKLIAYTSDDSHYSILKSMNWLGLGIKNLRTIKCEVNGMMIVEDLEAQIISDLEKGHKPFFVNATAGTTILGAMDDIEKVGDICRKYSIWLHVDASIGGHLKLSRRYSNRVNYKGVDSLTFAPQKTLGAGIQCVTFLTKHKDLLSSTNSSRANYLFSSEKLYDTAYDIGDKSIQCGRRVDSLKLYMLFKCRGLLGIEKLIDNAFDCAEYFTQRVSKNEGFRLVIAKFQFLNVCFWYIPKHLRKLEENENWWNKIYEVSKKLKFAMQLSGQLVLSYNSLPQRNVGTFLRFPIKCHPILDPKTIDYIIERIEYFGENLDGIK